MLSLTGTPDPDDVDHLGIAVSTQYIEREMGPASGNETVSWLVAYDLRDQGTLISVKLN